jgi:hypothetical protein
MPSDNTVLYTIPSVVTHPPSLIYYTYTRTVSSVYFIPCMASRLLVSVKSCVASGVASPLRLAFSSSHLSIPYFLSLPVAVSLSCSCSIRVQVILTL